MYNIHLFYLVKLVSTTLSVRMTLFLFRIFYWLIFLLSLDREEFQNLWYWMFHFSHFEILNTKIESISRVPTRLKFLNSKPMNIFIYIKNWNELYGLYLKHLVVLYLLNNKQSIVSNTTLLDILMMDINRVDPYFVEFYNSY